MTVIVPNYFLEHYPQKVLTSDALFCVTYASDRSEDKIAVHTVMHSMILLMSGTKKLYAKEGDFSLDAGDIVLLGQGNYFMSEIIDNNAHYESLLVYFDDQFIIDFVAKHCIDLGSYPQKSVVSFSSDAILKNLVDSYRLYMDQPLEKKHTIIQLKTEEIFLHLWEQDRAKFGAFLLAVLHSSGERAKSILESNIDLITSIEDMCKLTRLSSYELRQKMQKIYQKHPKAWLDEKRLEKAAAMLKGSDESITSIATSCGYATPSWFGVQFKKQFSMTPKMYRKCYQ